MREVLDQVRTPATERAVTRSADARLGAYAALAAVGARRGARPPAPGARRPRRAVRAARRARRRAGAALRAWVDIDRERALEGDHVDAIVTVRATRPSTARGRPCAADGLELAGAAPGRLLARARRGAELPLRCAAPLGLVERRRRRLRARDRLGRPVRGACRSSSAAAGLPDAGAAARLVAPPQTQAATGSEVAPRAGRWPRVRRHAPVRRRGPRPLDQLARDRAPRGASSSTSAIPSGTRTWCCSSTASRRRGRRDEGTLEMRSAPRRHSPAGFLERRDRVALVAFGGILRWLSPAAASSSSTAWSTRCSRPVSSSATRGRTSTSTPRACCRLERW